MRDPWHLTIATLTCDYQIYDQFEKRAQIQINRFIRNNTLLKK